VSTGVAHERLAGDLRERGLLDCLAGEAQGGGAGARKALARRWLPSLWRHGSCWSLWFLRFLL
jgi:hypothetical protein